jgi:hypothetical protein
LSTPTGAAQTELPAIYTAEPGDARPSICLIGASGTGKTEQLKRLMRYFNAHGLASIVIGIESKHQVLAELRPLVLPIGAPVAVAGGARPATPSEKHARLLKFRDNLRAGMYREHDGRTVGAIVFDGLMEIGSIVKAHRLANMPVSSKTGEQNTFRAFDEMGVDLIDIMASFKEAASDASKAYGIEPLGIAATCGEELRDGKFQAILPGRQASTMLPFQFEMVLRLATETAVDGSGTAYVAHTMPGEVVMPQMGRWDAKAPGGLFEPKIVNPDLGDIYARLIAHYKGETTTGAATA